MIQTDLEEGKNAVREHLLRHIPLEIMGTFSLCYVGGMAWAMADNHLVSMNGIALAHGGILALWIYMCAETTGGHFNPAVSLALFIIKKMPLYKFLMYAGAQFIGAMLGAAFIAFNLNSGWVVKMLEHGGSVLGYPNTSPGFSRWNCVQAEILGTMFFIIAILFAYETWAHKKEKKGHFAILVATIR